MKHLFFLATVAMITVKMSFTQYHSSSVRETYSYVKIMKPFSPNYSWENGIKQIKITEENLSQSCILCQLLKTKTLASGFRQTFFYFYHYLHYIYWVNVIYLKCLVFLKSPWWLVWIFWAPSPITWKIKSRK